MSKIFIIGGSGLVGTHVLKEFLMNGDSVTSLTRSGTSLLGEKVIKGDRSNKVLLEKIFSENSFDLVIDMIPFWLPDAKILYYILQIREIPLIACSSIDVYKAYGILWNTEDFTNYEKCPLTEKSNLRNNLGSTGENYNKLDIKKLYLTLPGDVSIMRLPAIYGYPEFTRIEKYLLQMLEGKPEIIIDHDMLNWKFSRVLNKNCAYGIFLARKSTGKQIYNLAEENTYKEVEWIKKIGAYVGWNGKITEGDKPWAGKIGGIHTIKTLIWKQNWYVDSSKIREKLGFYEKYAPDEGLFDCILQYIREKNNFTYNKSY